MKKQNMEEAFKLLADNHLNDMRALIDKMNQRKARKNTVNVLHFQLLNAAPSMAGCLLDILDELEGDELPVKDRPAVYLKIVEVLKEAGIVME